MIDFTPKNHFIYSYHLTTPGQKSQYYEANNIMFVSQNIFLCEEYIQDQEQQFWCIAD